MVDRYISFALRAEIDIDASVYDRLETLRVDVGRDDGAIVWINGVEVGRAGVPGARGEIVSPDARANGSGEAGRTILSVAAPKDLLVPGKNLLAIQVHNLSFSSSDCGVSVAARWSTLIVPEVPELPPVSIHEAMLGPGGFVELYWSGDGELDLGGLRLSTGSRLDEIVIPQGSIVSSSSRYLAVDASALVPTPDLRLFLSTGDRAHVIDAARSDAPRTILSSPWSFARLPDTGGRWWFSLEPTPGAPNIVSREEDVVLNEIHYHPIEREDELEWIEIHNRSQRTIDLSGFSLEGAFNDSFADGTLLGPQGYLVVARDPVAVRDAYDLDEAVVVGLAPNATPSERDA
ncbi:MAG TPA: lamin tail domain-containing protein, partial [Planctomycetota bacterium]|nr:lamin tail domain-containing protein [Planctomycetota bacterium]